MLLTVADVTDWRGIIPAIKAQAAARRRPGKRLVSLLPEEARPSSMPWRPTPS